MDWARNQKSLDGGKYDCSKSECKDYFNQYKNCTGYCTFNGVNWRGTEEQCVKEDGGDWIPAPDGVEHAINELCNGCSRT